MMTFLTGYISMTTKSSQSFVSGCGLWICMFEQVIAFTSVPDSCRCRSNGSPRHNARTANSPAAAPDSGTRNSVMCTCCSHQSYTHTLQVYSTIIEEVFVHMYICTVVQLYKWRLESEGGSKILRFVVSYAANKVWLDCEHRETLVEETIQEVFEVVGGAFELSLFTRFDDVQVWRDVTKETQRALQLIKVTHK